METKLLPVLLGPAKTVNLPMRTTASVSLPKFWMVTLKIFDAPIDCLMQRIIRRKFRDWAVLAKKNFGAEDFRFCGGDYSIFGRECETRPPRPFGGAVFLFGFAASGLPFFIRPFFIRSASGVVRP